jgi:hypothetical protein
MIGRTLVSCLSLLAVVLSAGCAARGILAGPCRAPLRARRGATGLASRCYPM